MAKPFVKWAGGKGKLVDPLRERVPASVRTYAEPFAGGAALFFALADDPSRAFERAVLADTNPDLTACYRAVKGEVEAVIRALSRFTYDEEVFYRVRDEDPSSMTEVERGARLIYLNHTCFNGLWRVNRAGKFNVPFGRYTNPTIVDAEGLRAASRALARTDIVTGDFAEVTRALEPGDFVYFDPPYVPLSKTSHFTAYAAGGFGKADQDRLAAELARLRDRGVLAMLSNVDSPTTRELYADFAVACAAAPRAINSKASARGAIGELIVMNWGPPGIQSDASAPPKATARRARRATARS